MEWTGEEERVGKSFTAPDTHFGAEPGGVCNEKRGSGQPEDSWGQEGGHAGRQQTAPEDSETYGNLLPFRGDAAASGTGGHV